MTDIEKDLISVGTAYLVCGTPRSGSSLLCEALKNTCLAGYPEEYFWRGDEPSWSQRWGTSSYGEYLQRAVQQGTTPNGVFGAKVMWGYFDDFANKLSQLPGLSDLPVVDRLNAVFPNLHYIWIRRQDHVRQAVSHWKAIQTNFWAWTGPEAPVGGKAPEYNFQAIDHLVKEIQIHEQAWRTFFDSNQISALHVEYETLIHAYQETAVQVLRFLGVPAPAGLMFGERRLRKLADEINEDWVHRYLGEIG
jgi:LPS sulfotransferase NodH